MAFGLKSWDSQLIFQIKFPDILDKTSSNTLRASEAKFDRIIEFCYTQLIN